MATEICERVRGSEATKLHRGVQSDGGLRADAKTERVGPVLLSDLIETMEWAGNPVTDESARLQKQVAWASDKLLELLKQHHPSHAPAWKAAAVQQQPETIPVPENPARSEQSFGKPALEMQLAGAETCGAPFPTEPPDHRPKISDIQRVVARQYDVTRDDILSSRRTTVVVRPRQVAMYLAKMLTLHSLPQIGRRFGNRDHTTCLHAVRKIGSLIQSDPDLAAEILAIRAVLESGRATCPHCHQMVPA